MELSNKMKVGTAYDTYTVPLNTYFEELDVNNKDFGLQGFVMKTIFDAGVATSIGSPVGSTLASGGNIVTPDQSDAGKAGVLGRGGGIAQCAVALNVTRYAWVQCRGIGRAIMLTTGALAAGDLGSWTGDDTVAVVGTDEEFAFVHALVVAAGSPLQVPAGGYLLLR